MHSFLLLNEKFNKSKKTSMLFVWRESLDNRLQTYIDRISQKVLLYIYAYFLEIIQKYFFLHFLFKYLLFLVIFVYVFLFYDTSPLFKYLIGFDAGLRTTRKLVIIVKRGACKLIRNYLELYSGLYVVFEMISVLKALRVRAL